jgi:hypothetical protein
MDGQAGKTVVVTRVVRPGRGDEFTAWAEEVDAPRPGSTVTWAPYDYMTTKASTTWSTSSTTRTISRPGRSPRSVTT